MAASLGLTSPSELEAFANVAAELYQDGYAAGSRAVEETKHREPEWRPTHRHADGGEYRFEREVMIKTDDELLWHPGVLYTNRAGKYFVTSAWRWERRFRRI
jgi:hypothetical protein